MLLLFAVVFNSAKAAGEVVVVESPFVAFTLVPAKAFISRVFVFELVQFEEPFVPSK